MDACMHVCMYECMYLSSYVCMCIIALMWPKKTAIMNVLYHLAGLWGEAKLYCIGQAAQGVCKVHSEHEKHVFLPCSPRKFLKNKHLKGEYFRHFKETIEPVNMIMQNINTLLQCTPHFFNSEKTPSTMFQCWHLSNHECWLVYIPWLSPVVANVVVIQPWHNETKHFIMCFIIIMRSVACHTFQTTKIEIMKSRLLVTKLLLWKSKWLWLIRFIA